MEIKRRCSIKVKNKVRVKECFIIIKVPLYSKNEDSIKCHVFAIGQTQK